jgi:CubicO group peptidase (beta-lactamase class C family)
MPNTRALSFSLVISLLTLFGCGAPKSDETTVKSLLEEEVIALKHYPFMTAYAETAEGEVLVSSAVANPDFYGNTEGPGVDDWMRIWSMSKLVTIVLALDLAEDGVFSLEDEAANYLPELAALKVARPLSGGTMSEASAQSYELNATEDRGQSACDFSLESPSRAMTIRDLMVHTAGFYYATTNLPCLDEAQAALELPLAESSDQWMQGISTLPLIQSPDEGYYYGLNTTVLGFLMERATGKSLQTLLEERVLEPYDIEGLSFLLPESAVLPPRVSGIDGELRLATPMELDIFGGHQPPYGSDTTLFLGGEGLVATAPGFAKFLRVVFFSRANGVEPLLEDASITAMTSPQSNADSGWGAMGYALWLSNGRRPDDTYGRADIWTGGGYEGTRYWIDPTEGRVGVIMTQVFMPPASGVSIEDKLRDLLDRQASSR